MQVGATELSPHQQLLGDGINSVENGGSLVQERPLICGNAQKARAWKVQKMPSSNLVDGISNLNSQTLVTCSSHQNQRNGQSLKVQDLQKYQQRRGAPIAESTQAAAPPTSTSE